MDVPATSPSPPPPAHARDPLPLRLRLRTAGWPRIGKGPATPLPHPLRGLEKSSMTHRAALFAAAFGLGSAGSILGDHLVQSDYCARVKGATDAKPVHYAATPRRRADHPRHGRRDQGVRLALPDLPRRPSRTGPAPVSWTSGCTRAPPPRRSPCPSSRTTPRTAVSPAGSWRRSPPRPARATSGAWPTTDSTLCTASTSSAPRARVDGARSYVVNVAGGRWISRTTAVPATDWSSCMVIIWPG